MEREIGRSRRRVEDNRLLRGAGRYPDDLAPPDALHAAFVRAPLPHARVGAIDAAAARAWPGVVAVLTAADLPTPPPVPRAPAAAGAPRESTQTAPGGPDFRAAPQPILAADAVHFVGEAVAVVLAETAAQARDAAERVEVAWEELASVSDVLAAAEAGAALAQPTLGTNLAFTSRQGTADGELEAAFARAAHVARRRLPINRLAAVAVQPLTVLAVPEPGGPGLTVWSTTQAPWRVRAGVARALGLAESDVRSIAPDVGGGFGVRGPVYPEYLAVALAAHRLGRAVRYTATRSEDFLLTRCARDVVADAEIAADADGRVLAIRARVWLNLGAYADVPGPGRRILDCLAGAYAAEAVAVELTGVYTNTTPTGAYRGAGRPEAAYIVERLVDALAHEIGADPVELRRRNFVPPDRFPYTTPLGTVYDSGDYAPAMDLALERVGYHEVRRRQEELRRAGARRLVGLGLATYVEPTASGWESGLVRVEPSGRVVAFSGSSSHGQGHATSFAQIVADRLGVPFDRVTVRQGDTAVGPPGVGTFGSRSTTLGGNALGEAADRVRAKAREIAAHLLEVATDDVVAAADGFAVAGAPGRVATWARVAQAAYGGGLPPGMELGLEAISYFHLPRDPFSFGACAALVAVDLDTGEVELERLVSIDDCGTVVNPLLLAGQSHGGLAQGIGAALFEWMRYDEAGQPLSGTLMDYPVPRASDLVTFELGHTVTPSPWNELGVKGHAEAGTIAAPPALVNAVVDALRPLGVRAIDPPLTPERVWRAIRDGAAR